MTTKLQLIKDILNSVFPVMTLFFGAWLFHIFTLSRESKKHLQIQQTQSYVEFLECLIGFCLTFDESNKEKNLEYRIRLESIHCKLMIYGHKNVVQAVSALWKTFSDKVSFYESIALSVHERKKIEKEIFEKFIPVVRAMRSADAGIKNPFDISDSDMMQLFLWGDLIDRREI